jgi:hypothetical protein
MTSGPLPQLASVPFGAGAVVPALFRAEPVELAVVLFRALPPVVLFRALVAVVLFGVGRAGVVLAGRAGVVLSAAFGAALTAAFGAVLVTAFGAALTAGVLGSLSVTASCHAFLLGTSGELSR